MFSEQAFPLHPDKLADGIADGVVDHIVGLDNNASAGIEVMVTGSQVVIGGEYLAAGNRLIGRNLEHLVPGRDICFIAQTQVGALRDRVFGAKVGAGDQAWVYGYWDSRTKTGLPLAHERACQICELLSVQGHGDGKVLVYDDLVVISTPSEDEDSEGFASSVAAKVKGVVDVDVVVNPPDGVWVRGGTAADTGCTNRKIVADTYGVSVPHGGGGLCGKDLSKIDRLGAYLARKVARDIALVTGAATVEIGLGYRLGGQKPDRVSLELDGAESKLLLQIPGVDEYRKMLMSGYGKSWRFTDLTWAPFYRMDYVSY